MLASLQRCGKRSIFSAVMRSQQIASYTLTTTDKCVKHLESLKGADMKKQERSVTREALMKQLKDYEEKKSGKKK